MDIYSKLVEKIIIEQENIVGPLALEQAKKVSGLSINWEKKEIIFQGDHKQIVEKLVEKYQALFGQASVEVCKDAIKTFKSEVTKDMLPQILQ